MKKYLLLLTLIALSLQGCHGNFYNIQTTGHINVGIKTDIDNLNNKVFDAFFKEDYSAFYNLLADTLKTKLGTDSSKTLFPQLLVIGKMPRRLLDEFYVQNSKSNAGFTVKAGYGNYGYKFGYISMAKESYTTMYMLGDSGVMYLVTLGYAKFKDKWQLELLRADEYAVCFKTAPDYYNKAKLAYEKGDIADAALNIGICANCEKPSNDFFVYDLQHDMDDLAKKIKTDAQKQFNFPYELQRIPTRPTLYGLSMELLQNSLYPCITYHTGIDLADTASLRKEFENIKQNASGILPVFFKNHNTIAYKAYNQIPDKKHPSPSFYRFIDRKKVTTLQRTTRTFSKSATGGTLVTFHQQSVQ